MKVFVRISMTEGGSTAVAMAKRASWAAAALPSASLFAGRLRNLSRPLKFKAWNIKRKHYLYTLFMHFFCFLLMCSTRNPDELSRRQRRRQQKLFSRKEEVSGGMSWGNKLTGSSLLEPSAQKGAQSQCWVLTVARHHRGSSDITTMEAQ